MMRATLPMFVAATLVIARAHGFYVDNMYRPQSKVIPGVLTLSRGMPNIGEI